MPIHYTTIHTGLFILSILCTSTLTFLLGMLIGAVCFPEIQLPPSPENDPDHDPSTRNS